MFVIFQKRFSDKILLKPYRFELKNAKNAILPELHGIFLIRQQFQTHNSLLVIKNYVTRWRIAMLVYSFPVNNKARITIWATFSWSLFSVSITMCLHWSQANNIQASDYKFRNSVTLYFDSNLPGRTLVNSKTRSFKSLARRNVSIPW